MLHFIAVTAVILLSGTDSRLAGQEIIFTENFSGFTTGSHANPSTTDASSALDAKTMVPGWCGTLIYPANGEVKIGKSGTPGWIETPLIDFGGAEGTILINFDIARWVNVPSSARVYIDGIEKGSVITLTDEFQTVSMLCTGVSSQGRIKIAGLTERFYLDNFVVLKGSIPTGFSDVNDYQEQINIYPVPVTNELTIKSPVRFDKVEVMDITGKIVLSVNPGQEGLIRINTSHLMEGVYFLRLMEGESIHIKRFIKSGK